MSQQYVKLAALLLILLVPSMSYGKRDTNSQEEMNRDWFISHLEWAGLWRGTIKQGTDVYPFELKLKRDGSLIEGYVREDFSTWHTTNEVRGKIDENGHFTLISNEALQWRCRLRNNGGIAGEHPNGPANDPHVPLLPFSTSLVSTISVKSATTKRLAGTTTTHNWDTFLDAFMTAVRNRNYSLLKPFIGTGISLCNEGCPPQGCGSDDVWQHLSDNAWVELDKTLHTRWRESRPSGWGRKRREFIDSTPCRGCEYEVLLGFEQDDTGQWHWIAWDCPGD
jgi:hypothetical protein